MKTKIIPSEYQHILPYMYTHFVRQNSIQNKSTDFVKCKGEMTKIQNIESGIITFYKNISRL